MSDQGQTTFQRPARHFAPHSHWMNDPNGLFYHEGVYHLYFQYNPYGIGHGNMSWGHATSRDLLTWEEHEVAILCDDQADIFSGSIVVDEHNTSGLGVGGTAPVIALYTAAATDGRNQSQALAYSTDGGMSFSKFAGNPVLDRGSRDFRDPKVFRYTGPAGNYWVMVAVEAVDHQVVFYRSENLIDWELLSAFGPQAAMGGVWECPDLFELPVQGTGEKKWVLLVSLNPGGVAGGSGTQYFIGDFDGTHFTPESPRPAWPGTDYDQLSAGSWLDWGRDFYAGVSFHGLPDNQRTLLAWMSNWDYARQLPHGGWRGSMSAARTLDLVRADGAVQIRQRLLTGASETAARRGLQGRAGSSLRLDLGSPTLINLQLDMSQLPQDGTPSTVRFYREDGSLISTVHVEVGQIRHERPGGLVDHDLYASTQRMPLPQPGQALEVDLLLDHGSVEILAAGGLRSLTDQLTGENVAHHAVLDLGHHADIRVTALDSSGDTVLGTGLLA